MKTFGDSSIRWFAALSLAAIQTANGMYAIISASLDRLARDPCLAGIYGAQVSFFILAVVVVWSMVLAVKSLKRATWHDGLKPLGVVAVSSAIAIFLGAHASVICFP